MAGLPSIASDKPTILALGDSITEGGKTFVCYRQVLIPELQKRNVPFEFIGPKKDATSAHAGYSGKNTQYLRGISKEIFKQYPADIVMIHSGHNSFSEDKPVPGIVRDTEAIIDDIWKINPEVHILLAQVIPAGKLPKYSYIPELNMELASLAKRLEKKGVHITLVNQADGFDWKNDAVPDNVHPNSSGAKKMADKWMTALLPLLRNKDANTR
jgi:lysophospholipase L1-like esterase